MILQALSVKMSCWQRLHVRDVVVNAILEPLHRMTLIRECAHALSADTLGWCLSKMA